MENENRRNIKNNLFHKFPNKSICHIKQSPSTTSLLGFIPSGTLTNSCPKMDWRSPSPLYAVIPGILLLTVHPVS